MKKYSYPIVLTFLYLVVLGVVSFLITWLFQFIASAMVGHEVPWWTVSFFAGWVSSNIVNPYPKVIAAFKEANQKPVLMARFTRSTNPLVPPDPEDCE